MIKRLIPLLVITSALIFFSCDRDISSSPPDPEPSMGEIKVTSDPPGYDIYFNDRITGSKTPYTFKYIDSGEYKIDLKSYYMLDTSKTIFLEEDQQKVVHFNVMNDYRFYGSFEITTRTNKAEIFINGEKTGFFTPKNIVGILPGNVELTLKANGCRDYCGEVFIASGEHKKIRIVMEDTTLWVQYNSENSPLPTNEISTLGDEKTEYYLGTKNMGLLFASYPHFEATNKDNSGLDSYNILDMIRASEGMWAVTDNGVYFQKQPGNIWSNLSSRFPEVTTANIKAAAHNYNYSNETIYLATSNQGLIIIKGDVLSNQRLSNSVVSDNLTDVEVTYDGFVAVGSKKNGVYLRKDDFAEWQNYQLLDGDFTYTEITDIDILDKGWSAGSNRFVIYAGTTRGRLYKFENDVWVEIYLDKANYISSISCGADGIVWVGSSNGIYKIQEGKGIKNYTMTNSNIPSNVINDLQAYSSYFIIDYLKVATNQGYVIFKYGAEDI